MSSYTRRNTKPSTATPFCVVCRDAGKSEKEYTSHFVKDQPGPNGKVVCPTLLNQACRICAKQGHTSSYCPEYRGRREERYYNEHETPRREERYYNERETPRREERYYNERETPRREERYYNEHETPRREERYYNERETPRREEKPRYSYNDLREDTERHEREIQDRNDKYRCEEERRSKPWLQVALKQQQRHVPYAHPHGPRVRLTLEKPALCASKHCEKEDSQKLDAIDIRKVNLNHAANWEDEDVNEPFVCDPQQMFVEFAQSFKTSEQEYKFIIECDNQSSLPFECGE